MDNNSGPPQQAPLTKKGMSDFRKALLWTAIPILGFSLISAGINLTSGIVFGLPISIAAFLLVAAIIVCIGFAIARKRQIAMGILAGIGIGIVGMGITCFTVPLISR